MRKHRSLFESRVQGYTVRAVRDWYALLISPAQTKVKRRKESIWDLCPWAHRAWYLAGGDWGAREGVQKKTVTPWEKRRQKIKAAAAKEIRQVALQSEARKASSKHANMAGMSTTLTNVAVLTKDDIPGASLSGRKPSELKNEELKFWLRCRGDPGKGLKDQRPKWSLWKGEKYYYSLR